MSENERIYRKLQEMYPFAYALVRLISINYTKIYKDILPNSDLRQDEKKTLQIHVGLDNEGNPRLNVEPDSMILLTSIAESLMKVILKNIAPDESFEEIEKRFILENKVCPNPSCGEINKIADEVCYKCRTRLA